MLLIWLTVALLLCLVCVICISNYYNVSCLFSIMAKWGVLSISRAQYVWVNNEYDCFLCVYFIYRGENVNPIRISHSFGCENQCGLHFGARGMFSNVIDLITFYLFQFWLPQTSMNVTPTRARMTACVQAWWMTTSVSVRLAMKEKTVKQVVGNNVPIYLVVLLEVICFLFSGWLADYILHNYPFLALNTNVVAYSFL